MGLAGKSAVSLLLAAATPVFAAQSMTVAQFSQWIDAQHGKSDAKIAHQIPGMQLAERASNADLSAWEKAFPGPHTHEALVALTDASRFLAPPAAQILQEPAPDLIAQQRMLSRAVAYVGKTLSKLPDFSATRETMHFEDKPEQQQIQQSTGLQTFSQRGLRGGSMGPTQRIVPAEPMHFVTQSSIRVTYRDGLEVGDAQSSKAAKTQIAEGLTTTGEFGPILSVIVGDAVRSDVQWGNWEKDSGIEAAVFRYSVPEAQSHFTVAPPAAQNETFCPPYQGEIAINPATGEILRLTVISDLRPRYQQAQVAIMVEYAPVTIGDRLYICPVKGVAVSRMPITLANSDAKHPAPTETRLNDVSFTNYHLFRAEATILP
jgi:hypothetical protein